MSNRLRPAIAVLAIVLAGAMLSACGDKVDKSGASTPSASTTSPVSKGVALTQSNFATVMTAAMKKAATSHATMDMTLSGQPVKAAVDISIGSSADDTAMAMTMDMAALGAGKVEMRLIGRVMYISLGAASQGKFLKVDLNDTSSPLGATFGQILGQVDPSKPMEQYAKALKSFEKRGDAVQIDGVDAQPYVIILDTVKWSKMSALAGKAAASLPDTLTFTLFVGPDNLPRRVITDVGGSKTVLNYSKWGEAVNIRAPAAGDISDQDPSSLFGGAAPAA
jgi:hypothetical protein